MFKYQKLYWFALVVWNTVQGTLAFHVRPMACGVVPNPEFSPYYNLFMQIMNERGSFDGNQDQLPLPRSLLLPGGSNGVSDFCNVGPCGSPTYGCPPFYGCMRGPFGPIGNRWPMPGPVGPNMAQKNGNFQQCIYGDPNTTFNDLFEENSGGEDCEMKGKASQCSSKCRTTKKPYRRTRDKICIA